MMDATEDKKYLIYQEERKFAFAVASHVIDKPQLSLWMILIPVIFVYHFYRLKKYADGRKEFAHNFMITRERALNETEAAIESDRKPDLDKLVSSYLYGCGAGLKT